jgi:PKHD-type hydroxylase
VLVEIPDVLAAAELAEIRRIIDAADLVDGRETAGELAAQAKRNLQLPQEGQAARDAGEIILKALGRNPLFNSVALPFRVLPPLFNRYEAGMAFDAHVDGAVRAMPWGGPRMRADVSSTLFLTDPEDYDGGELLIEHAYGTSSVKLAAGAMIVYPAGSLHRVAPVTRGARTSAFFWTQSMLKDDGLRALLYDLDMAIIDVRQQLGRDTHGTLALTGVYHNLLRRAIEL